MKTAIQYAALMSDFGARLKAAREARGVSLRQIAAATKISMSALEALERGDFARLPGGIFSRAFVRAYALQVGLDPEETVNQFLVEYGEFQNNSAEAAAPEVSADDREFLERQRKAAMVLRIALIVIVLEIIAALVWFQMQRSAAKSSTSTIASGATRSAPPSTSSSTSPAPTKPATSPPPTRQDSRLIVAVEATAPCWMEVTVDGTTALARLLDAGEREEFRADRDVQLQVGNAGALKWTINGKPAKALGKMGATGKAHVTKSNVNDFLQ